MVELGGYRLRFEIVGRSLLQVRLPVQQIEGVAGDEPEVIVGRSPGADDVGVLYRSVPAPNRPSSRWCDNGRVYYLLQRYPRYRTCFDGSFDGLLAGLSAKRRSTLRRKVRKFARASGDGEIDWQEYRDAEGMREFLEHAVPLARGTYQARLFDGALPEDPDFARDAQNAAAGGLARGYLLFLEGRAVAYLYTPVRGESLVFAYLGYDPECAALSPGIVLQYLVHQRLFQEKPVRYFDFTGGEGDHKALFATERQECCDLLCMPAKWRWRLLFAVHAWWNALVTAAKHLADRLGLRANLRRLVRR